MITYLFSGFFTQNMEISFESISHKISFSDLKSLITDPGPDPQIEYLEVSHPDLDPVTD